MSGEQPGRTTYQRYFSGVRRSMRRLRWPAGVAVAVAVAVAAGCLAHSGRVGLAATCYAAGSGASTTFEAVEPGGVAVESASATCGSRDIRVVWSGVLWVAEDVAQLSVATAGRVTLTVDGRTAVSFDAGGQVRGERAAVALARGAHVVTLEYERLGRAANLQLQWQPARADGQRAPIPVSAFSPRSLSRTQQLARAWSHAASWVIALAWLGLLSYAAARWLLFRLVAPGDVDAACVASLAICAVLFAAGAWWGWPSMGWPPDELEPGLIVDAWRRRFSGGWFDKYPPVSFYLLALAYAPLLVAEQFGRVSTWTGATWDLLYMQSRLVSLVLSVGTVATVGLLAIRLGHRRVAWLAMLLAGAFLPMPFYAKTANVDACYLFFYALSMLFFARATLDGRLRDFLGLGAFAALAVASKDQAYALYALPGLYLAVRAGVGGVAAPRKAHIAAAAAACLATWALAQNAVFNPDGLREHVLAITGSASTDYRMFSSDVRGQLQLLAALAGQVVDDFGWAGLIGIATSVISARRQSLPAIPRWFWLVGLSYWVTFAAVVGYSYDRFLLPLTILYSIPAAVGLGSLIDRSNPARWQKQLGVFLIAWIVMRAVGVNALMIGDARYSAESWLQREVPPQALVASFGQSLYLPRLDRFNHAVVRPGIAETLALAPEFIVLNTELMQPLADDPTRREWLRWLESGEGPYREVFRYKAPAPWYSPLVLDRRFRDRIRDPFTNLDKINPEIAIFRLEPSGR